MSIDASAQDTGAEPGAARQQFAFDAIKSAQAYPVLAAYAPVTSCVWSTTWRA